MLWRFMNSNQEKKRKKYIRECLSVVNSILCLAGWGFSVSSSGCVRARLREKERERRRQKKENTDVWERMANAVCLRFCACERLLLGSLLLVTERERIKEAVLGELKLSNGGLLCVVDFAIVYSQMRVKRH